VFLRRFGGAKTLEIHLILYFVIANREAVKQSTLE